MSEEKTSQCKRYEKYANTIKTLFFVAGLWPGHGSPEFSIYIVALYSSSIIVISLASINFIVHNSANFVGVTRAMGTFISGFTVLVKVTMFSLYRSDMKKMHEILERQFRNDFSRSERQSVLLSSLHYFYQPTMLMTKIFIMLSVTLTISPLISMMLQLFRGVNPIQYELPFIIKYPWNPKSSVLIYVAHYFLESIVCLFVGCVSVTVDAGLGYYVFQITTQFRVLAYRMSILESSSDYRQIIRECILRHRSLAECCNSLERAYGPVALWIAITNALSLCVNVYQLSKIKTESIATSMLFVMVKFMQSLFYGWIGTFLTTETESFRDAVYSSGWAGSGEIPFMTSVLIILMWKPLVLTALSFSTISLDMFIATLNTALSYFLLLQTLEEKR